MESMGEQFPIDRRTTRLDGSVVETKKIQGPVIDETIDSTAGHEGAHTLMALLLGVEVIKATNVPGPGYEGYMQTEPVGDPYKHALISAAAEAKGYDGTGAGDEPPGSDMWHIRQSGFEPKEVVRHARQLLSGERQEEKLAVIATQIQRKRTINGTEAKRAKKSTNEKTKVVVNMFNSEGIAEHQQVVTTPHRATLVASELPRETPLQERCQGSLE